MLDGIDLNNDGFTRIARKKKRRGETDIYVNSTERATLITTINDAAALLFTYYVEKSGVPGFKYSDDSAVKTLGWGIRKTQRTRLELIKEGWFKQITYTNPTTKSKVLITYLGKEACTEVMTPEEYTLNMKRRSAVMAELKVNTWEEAKIDKPKLIKTWKKLFGDTTK